MQLKLIARALTLALGFSLAGSTLAAGENTTASSKRLARVSSEDVLARTVFQTLVAEFALRQGDPQLASDAWTDLAQRTRDPEVIARATDVATFAKQYDRALELTKLWLSVDPEATKARQIQSSLLVQANRIPELAPQLAALLAQDKDNLASNLMNLNRMLARINDPKAVQQLIDRLATPYTDLPEAHFAMAQAAASAGDTSRSLEETEKAIALRPDWEMAAIARAQLQAIQSPATALIGLGSFVERNPKASEARMLLARLLITEKRYDEARRHFEKLLTENPDKLDIIYPVAVLALQQGDSKTGRQQLERLLNSDFPDKSTVHYLLGQLDQEQNHPDAAVDHFLLIGNGEQYLPARTRAAQIRVQQGRIEEARKLLQETRGVSGEQLTQLRQTEAQILRDANRLNDAYIVLDNALTEQPDNVDLLYDAALTADRLDKPALLEQHLKHLLKLQPNHPHALNALGYSWAERDLHLDEAKKLIEQALAQLPDDPFITDSLGWVYFRQGKLAEAQQTLEKAYKIKADPEIAAHLSEVLWAQGRKDDARKLLRDALKANPDNAVLNATTKKLQP